MMLTTMSTRIRDAEIRMEQVIRKCQCCIGSVDIEDVVCTNISCRVCFEYSSLKQELRYYDYIQRLIFTFTNAECYVFYHHTNSAHYEDFESFSGIVIIVTSSEEALEVSSNTVDQFLKTVTISTCYTSVGPKPVEAFSIDLNWAEIVSKTLTMS